MSSLKRVFFIFLLSLVVGGIQGHLMDSESYLNTISLTDKNKDYDRDGSTENVNHDVEILKDYQFVFVSSLVIRILEVRKEIAAPAPIFLCHLSLSDYQTPIFRPPIAA